MVCKKEIAQESIEKVALGESKFYPNHWINSFNAWMKDLRDWCISRQLWWGHQIPVYCANALMNGQANIRLKLVQNVKVKISNKMKMCLILGFLQDFGL